MKCSIFEIFGACPVKSDIGEWCLRSPSRWNIESKDEILHLLKHIGIGFCIEKFFFIFTTLKMKMIICAIVCELCSILMNKWCKICIKWWKCLCSSPFILECSEKINHLIDSCLEILWWGWLYSIGHPIESLFQELSQTPSSAITGEHIKIMNMIVSVSVSISYLLWIDMW